MFSFSSKWWHHQIWLILSVDSTFIAIIEISIINYLNVTNLSFVCYWIIKILATSGKQTTEGNWISSSISVQLSLNGPWQIIFSSGWMDSTWSVTELDKKIWCGGPLSHSLGGWGAPPHKQESAIIIYIYPESAVIIQ